MPKFDVEIQRTIYVGLCAEADTQEEAERIAEEYAKEWTNINDWNEHPSERRVHTMKLKIPE